MPTNRYFENFPVIKYANSEVIDITKRVTLLESVSADPYSFYPYEITEQERPDQFSNRYYEDSYKSWILYLTNKMVDPYHEWHMSQEELEEFVEKKYGSLYVAKNKVKHYKNSYLNTEDISISSYNALPVELKRYWEPVYGAKENKIGYTRKKVDWVINTNKIVYYVVNNSKNFIIDEICDIVYNTEKYGKAQVVSVYGNTVYMQHVSGQYDTANNADITANSYIFGNESETNTVFTQYNYVSNTIPIGELNYWKSVTYYDHELEKNEYNKSIRVLDKDLGRVISKNLKDLLKV